MIIGLFIFCILTQQAFTSLPFAYKTKFFLINRRIDIDNAVKESFILPSADLNQSEESHKTPPGVKHVSGDNVEDINVFRQNYVREMMLHAWNGYVRYAWGHNELLPKQKVGYDSENFGCTDGAQLSVTVVDSLDTLWIMGLSQQYQMAHDHLKATFSIANITNPISTFEVNIRILGGLLAAHALTNDSLYLSFAKEVADVLLKAFDTPTGIPWSFIVPSDDTYMSAKRRNTNVALAELGSFHLEFKHLSFLLGNSTYADTVDRVRNFIANIQRPHGLYLNKNCFLCKWMGNRATIGPTGDSFYEYLLKSYIQSGLTDEKAWAMYNSAIGAIRKNMLRKSLDGLIYFAEWDNGNLKHRMSHLACFCIGMFALQADLETDEAKKIEVMNLAEELGRTCHESYVKSQTGIGPEIICFESSCEAMENYERRQYSLQPEVIEGFFYLWRLTNKTKYREWIWSAIQAINTYCRTNDGFTGIIDVYRRDTAQSGVQNSYFMAETLKYAFLAFNDRSMISLDQWVFNTEAHPLPIHLERISTKSPIR